MRFQVSQVMDAIEQRLSTDVTAAQAVADLGDIVRNVESDGGRPVNLVRIGMVIDALSRYLVDGGAMLYGVVDRALLSESALTSKERMVLGRWADDGLIEVTTVVGDRPAEVADLTGLPLITLRPYPELADRFGWLADSSGRLLRLTHRHGVAALRPMDDLEGSETPIAVAERVVGRAKVLPRSEPPAGERSVPARPPGRDAGGTAEPADPPAPATVDAAAGGAGRATSQAEPDPDRAAAERSGTAPVPAEQPGIGPAAVRADGDPDPVPAEQPGTGPVSADRAPPEGPGTGPAPPAVEEAGPGSAGVAVDAGPEPAPALADAGPEPVTDGLPAPIEVFASRRGVRIVRTLVSRHRYLRGEPGGAHSSFLHRQWRCDGFECPVFGEHRRIGQPVPRVRGGVPVCPRHDQPVTDIGPLQPAYPVSIVVYDLPRRRVVVRGGEPVSVGRADDDPEVLSVRQWLHRAAAAWVGPVHLRLEAGGDGLVVTDVSENGTVVWRRRGPDDPGTTRLLHRESHPLGEWDSVELYTGIELVRGDRRLAVALGRDEPASVLVDAPTAAHHQVKAG